MVAQDNVTAQEQIVIAVFVVVMEPVVPGEIAEGASLQDLVHHWTRLFLGVFTAHMEVKRIQKGREKYP